MKQTLWKLVCVPDFLPRTEDGCIQHILYVDAENRLRLFFEKWRDRAALDEHFKQEGSLAFMRVVRRLNKGEERMEIREV